MRFIALIVMILISMPAFAQQSSSAERRAQIQEMKKEKKLQLQVLSGEEKSAYQQARREKLQEISNEKKALAESRTKRQVLKTMTPDERNTYMQERRSKWNMLTDEEKEAKRQNMIDRWSKLPPEVRTRRKERFNQMSEDRKQAFKERHPRIYEDLMAE